MLEVVKIGNVAAPGIVVKSPQSRIGCMNCEAGVDDMRLRTCNE